MYFFKIKTIRTLFWVSLTLLSISSCITKSELTGLKGTYTGDCRITQSSIDPLTSMLISTVEVVEDASIKIERFAEEGNGDGTVECEPGCGSVSEYPYSNNELYDGDTILIVYRPDANLEYRLMIFKGEGRVIVESNQTYPSGAGGVFIFGEYFK